MGNNLNVNWNYPTNMYVGEGRISEIADICCKYNIKRPLVVTDDGVADLPLTANILNILREAGCEADLFRDVCSNPNEHCIMVGSDFFRKNRNDGVIALGGGSGLDAGKAIALLSGQTRPLADFEDVGDNWTRVEADKVPPIIAVPTTAGTGSEVGRASVITFDGPHEKKIIFHPVMMPIAVINDPLLTVGLPPHLTAATGIDAFTHCFEAFCAPGYHPMADGIALEGMRLIKEWLPVAYKEGQNIEARTHMLTAASMGATAFQKGLGAVHALSHPVGALYDAHHGLTNAIFLPYVMMENKSAIGEKMDHLASYMGLETKGFEAVFKWVLDFRAALSIPNDARILGIKEADITVLAIAALKDSAMTGNPLSLTINQVEALYKGALNGGLT